MNVNEPNGRIRRYGFELVANLTTIAAIRLKFPGCLATSGMFLRPCDAIGRQLGSNLPISPGTGHANPRRHYSSYRPYAAHQAGTRLEGDGLHHPWQGRIHEPGRVGEGPCRPPNDP